jgi:protoheme IX farnesyltransferase
MHDYLELTKPRMVMANLFVAVGVYLFASQGHIVWPTFLLLICGLGFTIAGGCVLNNVYDKDIDAKMSRTNSRATASGRITPNTAMVFGAFLAALGLKLLWLINVPTLTAAAIGTVMYVFVYTPIKHKSGLALFPGAIAGATPPVIGYLAATGSMDTIAWLLGAFLFLWQIPHFLAVARYRFDEYAAANVPLLVKRPTDEHERQRARTLFFVSLAVLMFVTVMLAGVGLFA